MNSLRNAPCPCGSGRKYKKCCIFADNIKKADSGQKELPAVKRNISKPDDDEITELVYSGLTNMRRFFLDKKPHIKEYNKVRKMHQEIVDSMMDYHYDGKFERKITDDFVPAPDKPAVLKLIESHFDFDTREGIQAFGDMIIYKTAQNMNCITEEYINKNRYRKPEKIEFLHAMLNSKIGLHEVTEVEQETAYVYMRDVFTGEEIKTTDISLSGSPGVFNIYIYTRIITYSGISFNSGLSLVFNKKDPFIIDHIQKYKKDFNKLGEFGRFIELYNRYSTQADRVEVLAQSC